MNKHVNKYSLTNPNYVQSIGSIQLDFLAGNLELPGIPAAVVVVDSREGDDDVGGPGKTEVGAVASFCPQLSML